MDNKKDKEFIKEVKMKYLLDNSLLTKNQQTPIGLIPGKEDFKAFKRLQEIKDNVDTFVNKGGSLLISSNITGNGKTAWALKIMLNYFEKVWGYCDFEPQALFINVPTLFNMLKDDIREHSDTVAFIKQHITNTPLVVWDEIGVKTLTTYENDNLLSFIDRRINEGKANIYTSNLEGEQLKKALGERLYSRIFKNSEIIEFVGKDKRGIKKW